MPKLSFLLLLFSPLFAVNPSDCPDKLFAVHATAVFPKNCVLVAGFRGVPFKEELARSLFPNIRDTVHFALGEMVRPIKVGDQIYAWEESPYAIVMPLNTLLPQLVNLNCYDVFTLGSVAIDNASTTMIVPENELALIPREHKYTVWTYNPKVMKIREAVESVIKHRGGWAVKMLPNHSEDDLDKAILAEENIDINNSTFFSSLKEKYPYISIVGLRWRPFEGNSYLLGWLEKKLMPAVKFLMSGTFETTSVEYFTTETLEQQLQEIQETLAKVDQYVAASPFSKDVKREYEDKRFSMQSWINILTLEIALNRDENKTLFGASDEVWEDVDAFRGSFEELREVILSHDLPDYLMHMIEAS